MTLKRMESHPFGALLFYQLEEERPKIRGLVGDFGIKLGPLQGKLRFSTLALREEKQKNDP